MRVTKPIDLTLLSKELAGAGVAVPGGLALSGELPGLPGEQELYTQDDEGAAVDLPPEAAPVVDAHVAPPPLIQYAGSMAVHAITRTTDAASHEVFRFPCEQLRMYETTMVIRGVDAGNFVSKRMVGEFMWKRTTGNAVVVGITVVSDIKDAAAASWVPNCLPSGTDVVFTAVSYTHLTLPTILRV